MCKLTIILRFSGLQSRACEDSPDLHLNSETSPSYQICPLLWQDHGTKRPVALGSELHTTIPTGREPTSISRACISREGIIIVPSTGFRAAGIGTAPAQLSTVPIWLIPPHDKPTERDIQVSSTTRVVSGITMVSPGSVSRGQISQ